MQTLHIRQTMRHPDALPTEPGSLRGLTVRRDLPPVRWELEPDHVPALLRGEYRWLRSHGVPALLARWHVNRMCDMIGGTWSAVPTTAFAPDGFTADHDDPTERRYRCDECGYAIYASDPWHPTETERMLADAHYETDHGEPEPEPDEGDVILADAGSRGYTVTVDGRHIGTFDGRPAAVTAVWRETYAVDYYPNVWFQDDHGGYTLVELETEDHEHTYGELETARMGGHAIRRCVFPGCSVISALDDDDDDDA